MNEIEENKDKIIKHMEGISFVLGKAHSGIFKVLESDDDQLRERLQELFERITQDVIELYYS